MYDQRRSWERHARHHPRPIGTLAQGAEGMPIPGWLKKVSRLSRAAKKPAFWGKFFGEKSFWGFSENSRLFLAFWRIEMMSNTMKAPPAGL